MPEELKKCPFCGAGVIVHEGLRQWIYCLNQECRLCDLGFSPEEWNSRPLEDALQKRVQELEEQIHDANIEASEEYPD